MSKKFTLQQIEEAHAKVQTGADFPQYVKDIKNLGVAACDVFVKDGKTHYRGEDGYEVEGEPAYDNLLLVDTWDTDWLKNILQRHQAGETDYHQFCTEAARAGVHHWTVDFNQLKCAYYNKLGQEILSEDIPH